MESNILNSLGLSNIDPGIYVIALLGLVLVLFIISISTAAKLCKLKKRYLRFTAGKDAKSLEKEIGSLFVENEALRDTVDRNKKDIRVLYKRMENAFQKVGVVKYNAFAQMGGELSFSIALLDERNDGFILNSVHGGEGCYTYTKKIKNGKCDLQLGEEEQKALNIAMGV